MVLGGGGLDGGTMRLRNIRRSGRSSPLRMPVRAMQDHGILDCINRAKIMSAGAGYKTGLPNKDMVSHLKRPQVTSGQSVLVGVRGVGGVSAFWHDKPHTQIKTMGSPCAYCQIDLSGAGRKLFGMTLYSNLDYDLAKLLESTGPSRWQQAFKNPVKVKEESDGDIIRI